MEQHRGGSLDKTFREWEHNWYIERFERVRAWLCDADPAVKDTLESLPDPNRFLANFAAAVDQVPAYTGPTRMNIMHTSLCDFFFLKTVKSK
jgi:hypothetical protein